MSEKRSGRGVCVSRTHVFYPAFSLRVCMYIRSFSVSFDMCWYSHDVTMFPWLKSQRKEFPASSTCSIASCCLVCSGLHAGYTDALNGSNRFPFRHEHKWYSVLVHVPGIQMVVVVIAVDTARSGEVLCFVCNNGDQD